MSWVDDDIRKLATYASSLDVAIDIRPFTTKREFEAAYFPVDKKIVIYSRTSRTYFILVLIHEISHVREERSYKNKKDPVALAKALRKQDNNQSLTKADRKAIYKSECIAADFALLIAQELDLKVPKYKLKAECRLDKMVAMYYYRYNRYPDPNLIEKKRKQLRERYYAK